MELRVGDKLYMKKPHPCGGCEFALLRVGIDLRLRCERCGREFLAPRIKIEKHIKSVTHKEDASCL